MVENKNPGAKKKFAAFPRPLSTARALPRLEVGTVGATQVGLRAVADSLYINIALRVSSRS